MEMYTNASLRGYNSFGVDAFARQLICLKHSGELPEIVEILKSNSNRLILGGGSNILILQDFDGLVIINELKGKRLLAEDENTILLEVAAGENWHNFVLWTLKHGYYGLENLSLIPGSVGAAPIQNIGAYGVELESYFESLKALDLNSGEVLEFDKHQCEFGYRDSIFKRVQDSYLITSVCFRLDKMHRPVLDYSGVREKLAEQDVDAGLATALQISDAICELRVKKLPSPESIGNAGSFFKNPVVSKQEYSDLKLTHPYLHGHRLPGNAFKISAAWLIEQCGWKGYREGDAGVYGKHALVLVNYGEVTGEQIYKLAGRIRASVLEKFGVILEAEPRIISANPQFSSG